MFGANRNQSIAIFIAVLSVTTASTGQLTELFGPLAVKIISAAGFLNGILGAILAVLTGQSQMVKDVAAMPGVESIKVNAQANQTLASIAVDTTASKVSPTAEAKAQVTKTAGGG